MKFFVVVLFAVCCLQFCGNGQTCNAWFWFQRIDSNLLKIRFIDDSFSNDSILTWNWKFGDGTQSNLKSPVHEYSTSGAYHVTLRIQTPTCIDSSDSHIFVSDSVITECQANFSFSYTLPDSLSFQFYDLSTSPDTTSPQWEWNFGDNNLSYEQNPFHSYQSSGIYNVTLNYSTANCFSSYRYTVYAGNGYYNGDSCYAKWYFEQISPNGLTFNFYDASWTFGQTIENFIWDFGDNNTSNNPNPTHTFPSEGSYNVSLQINTPNCSSQSDMIIYAGSNTWYPDSCQALFWVNANPDNNFQIYFHDFSYSNGNINYWQWDFGDGNLAYQQNPYHTYSNQGTYYPSLTIFSDSCVSTISLQLEIPFVSNNTSNCICRFYPSIQGNFVTFYDLSIGNPNSWYWDFGDNTFSYVQNPTHEFDEIGIHEVALSIGGNDCNNVSGMILNLHDSQISYMYFPHPTGIRDLVQENILIYPNPVQNNLNLLSDNQIIQIKLFDITGNLLIQKYIQSDVKQISLDISTLNQGLYLVQISTKNGLAGSYRIFKQ